MDTVNLRTERTPRTTITWDEALSMTYANINRK